MGIQWAIGAKAEKKKARICREKLIGYYFRQKKEIVSANLY